ncbi:MULTISPECIES: hypothetical protein [unclassified Pseudocitrobacter]|uniref:hypothetical protein n=1 Tax=unclassified Pseudocitrobacter TaxID=2638778 RepID=UPI0023E3E84F|nr:MULTISPECIES: hypothetical protein [unclassified Pseudocitrobacter]MDF3829296.1 hypothetical protein [Pseudocitrobacter sp. 2023EL-00150]MEC5375115.1 hypothetical protein [Pseudocitrobacter sp. MW920760]
MIDKRFAPEVTQRLFTAVEEDDYVDAQVSLPPVIDLHCTPEIIQGNYALCLQFWEDGVKRRDLLQLTLKQAAGRELSEQERMQYKYMRARFKHLRFAQRLYLQRHYAGFIFGKTTVFLGRFQDGFRNQKKDAIAFYGRLLRFYLSAPAWAMLRYCLRHSRLASVDDFIAYRQGQIRLLKALVEKPLLTGREFHDVRKIISQQVSYYDTLRSIDPENREARQVSRFLAAINGLMGDKHDEMVADDMENRLAYETPVALDEDIRQRLALLLARFPL